MRLLPPVLACCCLLLCACPREPVLPGPSKGLVEADVARAHAAVLDLLRDSEPMVEQETLQERRSLIQARFSDGVIAVIELRHVTETVSHATIRIGQRGDRVAAGRLLERIRRAVGGASRRP